MSITPVAPLDEQITALIQTGATYCYPAAKTASHIIHAIEMEQRRPCKDQDCVRLWPHSRLGPHCWRHEASAPLGHPLPGFWTCFICHRPAWARIHRRLG